jgi:hypothetical protein
LPVWLVDSYSSCVVLTAVGMPTCRTDRPAASAPAPQAPVPGRPGPDTSLAVAVVLQSSRLRYVVRAHPFLIRGWTSGTAQNRWATTSGIARLRATLSLTRSQYGSSPTSSEAGNGDVPPAPRGSDLGRTVIPAVPADSAVRNTCANAFFDASTQQWPTCRQYTHTQPDRCQCICAVVRLLSAAGSQH